MSVITAIIIDDEIRARTLLSGMLNELAPNISVLAECADLPNGVKSIRKFKPNLVFLDIEMPGHSGLELLDFFNEDEIDFKIIFITAYNEYATKAFKLSAIDYLLKPLDADELIDALRRFQKSNHSSHAQLQALRENIHQSNHSKIAVPVGQAVRVLDLNHIFYFKAEGSYTEIYFDDLTKLMVSRTLKNFEEVMDNNSNFFRCHKSYIVNFNFITDYVKSDGGYVLLKDKSEIPISYDKVAELLEKMQLIKR